MVDPELSVLEGKQHILHAGSSVPVSQQMWDKSFKAPYW